MQEFIDKLEALGFYTYTDPTLVLQLKASLQSNGYLFEEETRRLYPFDYEFLAEGGVKEYFERLLPFLIEQGVSIESVDQFVDDEGLNYYLRLDGRQYIFLHTEFDKADTWGLTATRTFTLINHLLREAGSKEVFYILGGDPESRLAREEVAGVFLTPDLYQLITESPLGRGKRYIEFIDESTLNPQSP